jgi:DNA-binding response OmpR family regulator
MSPSILVVEDEPDLVGTYERILRRMGYAVITAGTRQAALDTLRSTPTFDLVIADLRLPDGDGLDVVRAARQGHSATPVIVVTGYASEASRVSALAAGASAYVAKPFAIAWFADLVREQLRPVPGNGQAE